MWLREYPLLSILLLTYIPDIGCRPHIFAGTTRAMTKGRVTNPSALNGDPCSSTAAHSHFINSELEILDYGRPQREYEIREIGGESVISDFARSVDLKVALFNHLTLVK